MLIVACRAMISGDKGVSVDRSRSFGSGCAGSSGLAGSGRGAGRDDRLRADFLSGLSSSSASTLVGFSSGEEGGDSSSEKFPFVAILWLRFHGPKKRYDEKFQ